MTGLLEGVASTSVRKLHSGFIPPRPSPYVSCGVRAEQAFFLQAPVPANGSSPADGAVQPRQSISWEPVLLHLYAESILLLLCCLRHAAVRFGVLRGEGGGFLTAARGGGVIGRAVHVPLAGVDPVRRQVQAVTGSHAFVHVGRSAVTGSHGVLHAVAGVLALQAVARSQLLNQVRAGAGELEVRMWGGGHQRRAFSVVRCVRAVQVRAVPATVHTGGGHVQAVVLEARAAEGARLRPVKAALERQSGARGLVGMRTR